MRNPVRAALALFLAAALVMPPAVLAGDDKKDKKNDPTQIGNRNVGGGFNLYSLESEIALGKQFSQQIEQNARLVEDPVVVEYVNRVAQNLVRNSDARVPFTVKVIDSNEINAFALPGGFFYVNTGLILAADEEAELAGVLAHEIAHVTARHATKDSSKAQLVQWATIPLILLGPGGWAGYGIYQGLGFGLPLAFLKFNRNAEREADFLGLQYMWKAGYDPTAFISFFEKVKEKERKQPGSVPKIFSTHPPTQDRVASAQREIADLLPDRDEYVVNSSEFQQVKQRLAQLVAGRKLEDEDANRPSLRGRDRQQKDDKDKKQEGDEDKPPELKRRP